MPRLKQTPENLRIVRKEIQSCEELLAQAENNVITWICSQNEQECPHDDTLDLRHKLYTLQNWVMSIEEKGARTGKKVHTAGQHERVMRATERP